MGLFSKDNNESIGINEYLNYDRDILNVDGVVSL